MSRWILKAALQRTIGFLPGRHLWNELFREHLSGSVHLSAAALEDHLAMDARHLNYFWKYAGLPQSEGFTAFELGTGWHPILPIALYLCGATDVWTCDLTPQLKLRRVQATVEQYVACYDRGVLDKLLPRLRANRVETLRSIAQAQWPSSKCLLEQMNIHLLVGDASQSGLPAASVDMIASNNVLEYISEEPLCRILREFRRIGKPGAVMSHLIDMADEYAYFDRSITQYNFLRFSDTVWQIINNPLISLNRLRISDFRRPFTQAGFDIVEEATEQGNPDDLRRVPLAARFKRYPLADLLVLYAWVVSQKPRGRDTATRAQEDVAQLVH